MQQAESLTVRIQVLEIIRIPY